MTTAIADTAGTRIGRRGGRRLAAAIRERPASTRWPTPATPSRPASLLAAAAERSLDVQYYIWHGDQVGLLLFEALRAGGGARRARAPAARRQLNTGGLDATLAALDAHPNIEVRLYNPFAQRGARALGFLAEFERLNRRMHNKSFTADGQVDASSAGATSATSTSAPARPRLRGPRRDRRGAGRARCLGAVRPLLEQRLGLSGGGPPGHAGSRRRRGPRRRASRPCAPTRSRSPTARPCATRPSCATCSRAGSPWNGRRHGSCTTIRRRRSTRTTAPATCCSFRSSSGPRPAGAELRPRLAVLRARRRGHGGARGAGAARRRGAHPHQLAGRVRGERRARRATRSAARRCCAAGVRLYELKPTAGSGRDRAEARGRVELLVGAARQDLRRGRAPDLRRLLQLRPALGPAQHRAGPGDRQPGPRAAARADCSTWPPARRPTRSGSARTAKAWSGSSARPRERGGTTPSPAPDGGGASPSACPVRAPDRLDALARRRRLTAARAAAAAILRGFPDPGAFRPEAALRP